MSRRHPSHNQELPSLPRAAVKVLEMVQNPDVDLPQLGKAIEMDPALAGKLLRLSNSSLFGLSREVTSVRQALVVLGLRTVKMAAISFTFVDCLPKGKANSALAGIWRRILTNSMGARLMAPMFGIDTEEAFLAGMMQDIAMLVFAKNEPEAAAELQERLQNDEGAVLIELEEEAFGVHHAHLGAEVLEAWSLPAKLVEAVDRHHEVDLSEINIARHRELHYLLAMSEAITDFLLFPTVANLDRFNLVSQAFGDSASEIDKFLQQLELRVTEMANILDLELPAGLSVEQVLLKALDMTQNMRVLHRDALPLRLNQELSLARRQQWPLSILLVKILNSGDLDSLGMKMECAHLVEEVSGILQVVTRESDSLFRLSNDVYCVLTPNTPVEGTERLIERIQVKLGELVRQDIDRTPRPTLGYGSVTTDSNDESATAETLLRQAVQNLASATRRDGVCVGSTV